MNKIKKIASSTKDFVSNHRVAIAVTLTAVACLTLNVTAMRKHNDFLKEKGLYDEFYMLNEED